MVLRTASLGVLAAMLSLGGCGSAEAGGPGGQGSEAKVGVTQQALSSGEAAGLRFMREEEKLARDVYLALGERYDTRVFVNIPKAEQRHMDAVLRLLQRYDVADPSAGRARGDFEDPALQAMHDELLQDGSTSLVAALRVGALIEEVDLLDLEERAAQSEQRDVLRVYANLARGSRNHLRAFVSQLERQGEDYAPQKMDRDAFDAIINSPRERGGRRGR